jgi:hypothetical protein
LPHRRSPMSENFTRANRDIEARIAQCGSALDLANLLHEMPVANVLNGAAPTPAMPERPVGTRLRARVEAPDGRYIVVSADSWQGLDVLSEGVKRGEITTNIL